MLGAPFGLGAVELAGAAVLGGVPVVVDGRELSGLDIVVDARELSGLAELLGDGDPVCDVGVHAMSAAATTAAAVRRRGCGRYMATPAQR